jgi:hypothetical protein
LPHLEPVDALFGRMFLAPSLFYHSTFQEKNDLIATLGGTGSITCTPEFGLRLGGTVLNDAVRVSQRTVNLPFPRQTWNKPRYVRMAVAFDIGGLHECRLLSCDQIGFTYYGSVASGILKGYVSNGVDSIETGTLATIKIVGEFHVLETRFYPAAKVEFCVDGVKQGELSTYLPTGADIGSLLTLEFLETNVAGGGLFIDIGEVLIVQE